MGTSENEETKLLTILVARERERERDTGMMMSTVVPRKGSTVEFAAKRIVAFIRKLGCEFVTVIIKSDQEPAIQALLEDVRRLRSEVKTIIELSPVGESASNGVVERGIQAMQGQVRTTTSALEKSWGHQIPDEHAIIIWIVEHAVVVLNNARWATTV